MVDRSIRNKEEENPGKNSAIFSKIDQVVVVFFVIVSWDWLFRLQVLHVQSRLLSVPPRDDLVSKVSSRLDLNVIGREFSNLPAPHIAVWSFSSLISVSPRIVLKAIFALLIKDGLNFHSTGLTWDVCRIIFSWSRSATN